MLRTLVTSLQNHFLKDPCLCSTNTLHYPTFSKDDFDLQSQVGQQHVEQYWNDILASKTLIGIIQCVVVQLTKE